MTQRAAIHVVSTLALSGCGVGLVAPTEPMGDRIELDQACDLAPQPSGLAVGDIAPDIVGFDQYGEQLDVHADLCDRHVLIARAGFD